MRISVQSIAFIDHDRSHQDMLIKYTIKPSNILGAGMGLFADENIPKGTKVWEFREEDHIIYLTKESLETFIQDEEERCAKIFGILL